MKAKKLLQVIILIGIAIFLIGISQYYLNPMDEYMGNTLITIGTIVIGVIVFIFYIRKSKELMSENKRYSKVALLLMPAIATYVVMIVTLMFMNFLDMPYQGSSVANEIGMVFTHMFGSVAYWSLLIITETTILILLIYKTPTV